MEANVTAQMNQILSEYGEEVEKLATEEFEAVAKETVNELKSTSPKRTGAYASSWGVKKEAGVGKMNVVVHNKKHYQLTHLLENGHVVRNKKGTYGRADAIKHIAPAAEKAEQSLVERLENKL